MSEVKRYHLTEAGLVEGESLGRLSVVLAADYDTSVAHIRELEKINKAERGTVDLAFEAVKSQIGATDALIQRAARLERALGGMLFAFDDGVGRDWSAPLLDFARTLTHAVEFKSAEATSDGHVCPRCGTKGWTANCSECVPY